jgi:hypothetical protein
MTDPKKPPSSGAQSRSKASEPAPAADTTGTVEVVVPSDPLNRLLEQLAKIADSVAKLPGGVATREPAAETGPAAEERRKAVFAYEFLGEVLGRRGFAVAKVGVVRDRDGNQGNLTFTNLGLGKTARVRAADNSQDIIENLQENVQVNTDIPNGLPIDSIVVLDAVGVPVAIGPCLRPTSNFIEGLE